VLLSSGSVLKYVENVELTEAYIAVLVSSVLNHEYSPICITTEEEKLVFKNFVIHFMEGKDDTFLRLQKLHEKTEENHGRLHTG
jgi:hypothetical protein